MRTTTTRREFVKTLLAGTAGLSLLPPPVRAARKEAFAFPLLGDLHYDKLSCHDLELLGREKPDDLRQVVPAIEASIDLPHELKVLGGINGPATGTEIGLPVSNAFMPRVRPSVEDIETHRTIWFPRCCMTSATIFTP